MPFSSSSAVVSIKRKRVEWRGYTANEVRTPHVTSSLYLLFKHVYRAHRLPLIMLGLLSVCQASVSHFLHCGRWSGLSPSVSVNVTWSTRCLRFTTCNLAVYQGLWTSISVDDAWSTRCMHFNPCTIAVWFRRTSASVVLQPMIFSCPLCYGVH